MRRTAAALALSLLAVACDTPAPAPNPSVRTEPVGEISVAYPDEPPGLNPYLVSTRTIATLDLLKPTMPTLLNVDASLGYRAGVARLPKGVDVAADGTSVTFRINKEATWSDGVTITASDVVFTWQTIMDPRWPIANRAGYDQIADIRVTDPKTFTIVLKRRVIGWRDLFSAGDFILPRHLLEGKDFTQQLLDAVPISGGPFIIERWERGLSVTYVPNPRWWGPQPKLKKVTVFIVPSIDTAARMFEAGRLDAVVSTSQVSLGTRLQGDGVSISRRYGSAWWELVFNTAARSASDARARAGIAAAFDRAGVVEALFKTEARVLNDPAPAKPTGSPFSRYVADAGRSKDLLLQGGYRESGNKITSPSGSDPVICSTGSHEVSALFERAVQKSFDRIGMQLEIKNSDAAMVQTRWLPEGICDMFIVERRGTKYTSLTSQFHSRYVFPHGMNVSRISDPALDALLDGSETGAEGERIAARVAELIPVLPLVEVQMVIATKGISGASANASVDGPLWDLASWGRKG